MTSSTRLVPLVHEAFLDAWALLQPIDCLGCGATDRACCSSCRAAIRPLGPVRVRCDASPPVPVWCAADYAGPVRGAVLALKEQGRVDAAKVLAPLLRAAVGGALRTPSASARPPPDPALASSPAPSPSAVGSRLPSAPLRRRVELVPVPTTRRAFARRGYDPLGLIVRCARLPASRVLAPRRTWSADEQKRRDRAGRLAARAARFRARGRLDGRAFVLVDDLATTGSTLAAACAAIAAAGGEVLGCAVVAAPALARRALGSASSSQPGAPRWVSPMESPGGS